MLGRLKSTIGRWRKRDESGRLEEISQWFTTKQLCVEAGLPEPKLDDTIHSWLRKCAEDRKGHVLVQIPTETQYEDDPYINTYRIDGRVNRDCILNSTQGYTKRELESAKFDMIKSVARYARVRYLLSLGQFLFKDYES